jgi:hypothetical protein
MPPKPITRELIALDEVVPRIIQVALSAPHIVHIVQATIRTASLPGAKNNAMRDKEK